MRKFKNKPVDDMCKICHPDKVTCEYFSKKIISSLPAFVENMKTLNVKGKKYPEDWMETFLAWYEINTER